MNAAASDRPLPQFASRTMAMMAHLSTLIGFFLSVSVTAGLLGPSLIWLASQRRDDYVARQAREALNFHISVLLYGLLLGALPLSPSVKAVAVVAWMATVVLVAGLAYEGRPARYPAAMPILRRPRRLSRS